MNPVLRRFVVLGTPLILGVLLTTHPVFSGPTGIFRGILSRPDWWLTIHVLLLPLFYLIALAAYLLIDGVQGVAATISKVALGVFVIFYPAFDVLIGIGTGTLVYYAAGSPSSQQAVIEKAIIAFLYSPIANLFVLLGSFHTSFARWPASAGLFLLRGQSCATLWSARHGMFLSGCPATRTTQLEISSCRAGVTFDTIDLRPKEALHEGIIITTPFATHTDLNAITSQQHPVVLSSILTAMIRMVQQAQLRIATG